eukprot:CAMPEP_0184693672 /NCGR_PEP_ID=MMETSP0313-20130426/1840_1 /TAXON_ID=2792 /ORGANISM="Porphyridium aerugineum, Strain SAG 1380-2" /LENGTH=518 /DNA_ID=CAMNT_0027151811 /DNA_START=8 /DNA_END=1565 /DNA_ORIENTATION=+
MAKQYDRKNGDTPLDKSRNKFRIHPDIEYSAETIAKAETNSPIVLYFHNIYRWGKPSTFDDGMSDYIQGLINAALPWWVVGALIAVACLVVMVLRFSWKRFKLLCDRLETYWRYPRSLKRHYIQAVLSLVFLQGIIAFGSTALMMNFSIRESSVALLKTADLVVGSAGALIDGVNSTLALAIDQVSDALPVLTEAGTFAASGDYVESRLSTLQSQVFNISAELESIQQNIEDLLHVISTYSLILFIAFGVIIFCSLFGPLLLSLFSLLTRTWARVCSMLVFLVPLLFGWAMLGAAVLVGSAAGDVCYALSQYSLAILYSNNVTDTRPGDSYFYLADRVKCSPIPQDVREEIKQEVDLLMQTELAVAAVANVDRNALVQMAQVIEHEVNCLTNCTIIVDAIQYFRNICCSDDSSSTIYAVLILYISYICMSFFLTFMFFAALFGMNMNEFAAVWPIWEENKSVPVFVAEDAAITSMSKLPSLESGLTNSGSSTSKGETGMDSNQQEDDNQQQQPVLATE